MGVRSELQKKDNGFSSLPVYVYLLGPCLGPKTNKQNAMAAYIHFASSPSSTSFARNKASSEFILHSTSIGMLTPSPSSSFLASASLSEAVVMRVTSASFPIMVHSCASTKQTHTHTDQKQSFSTSFVSLSATLYSVLVALHPEPAWKPNTTAELHMHLPITVRLTKEFRVGDALKSTRHL